MFLSAIIEASREDLDRRKALLPLQEVKRMALEQETPLNFAAALRGDKVRLIAELKKASPSRGVIRPDFDPVAVARVYSRCGAAAVSVLTEPRYFQGSLNILKDVRSGLGALRVPLLRKDFITDAYQVYESRAYGADAILLIAAALSPSRLGELLALGGELGMGCLVEVHIEDELETALASGAKIIGINNRNLKTFAVDISTTERLRPLVSGDRVVVSESGIKTRDDMERMRRWRVDAVLIGEALMSADDIPGKIRELIC